MHANALKTIVESNKIYCLSLNDQIITIPCQEENSLELPVMLFFSTEALANQYNQQLSESDPNFPPRQLFFIETETFIFEWCKTLEENGTLIGLDWQASQNGDSIRALKLARYLLKQTNRNEKFHWVSSDHFSSPPIYEESDLGPINIAEWPAMEKVTAIDSNYPLRLHPLKKPWTCYKVSAQQKIFGDYLLIHGKKGYVPSSSDNFVCLFTGLKTNSLEEYQSLAISLFDYQFNKENFYPPRAIVLPKDFPAIRLPAAVQLNDKIFTLFLMEGQRQVYGYDDENKLAFMIQTESRRLTNDFINFKQLFL